MAERYSRLFLLSENLYTENSPVIISAGALLKDNKTGKVIAQLKLKSISPRIIKAIKVKLLPLDTVNQPLNEEVFFEYLDLSVDRDEHFGQKTAITLPNASTRAFSVEVTEVDFADNSVWTSTGTEWTELPVAETIENEELKKQYRLRFGEKAEYKAYRERGIWSCACGGINHCDEPNCHICGNSISELLACDLAELEAEKEERLAQEKEEQMAREAAEIAAQEAEKAAAEAAKRKTRKILAIAIPALIVCIAALLVITKVIMPNNNYNKAKAMLDAGQYREAIAAFQALDGYKDSEDLLELANNASIYAAAESYLSEGKTYQAAKTFGRIAEYKDSWDRSVELWKTLTNQRTTISAGATYTVSLRTNGEIVGTGSNESGQLDLKEWKNIVSISTSPFSHHTIGLTSDGRVLAAGDDYLGCCQTMEWNDIVAVSTGRSISSGLRSNGTVVAEGDYDATRVSKWENMIAVYSGAYATIGIKADGTIELSEHEVSKPFYSASHWSNVVSIAFGYDYVVGLTPYGTCVAIKRDGSYAGKAIDIGGWKNIVAIAAGYNHTVGLQADGTVLATGDNSYGKCDVSDWNDIVAISAGWDFTIGLRSDGTVVATGNNEYGQCNVFDWTDIMLP